MSIFICFISLLTGILLANRSYLTIIFAFIILFFGAKYKFKIFGSRARGDYRSNSDIDIAIVSNVIRSKLFQSKDYKEFTNKLYNIDLEQDYDILQFNSLKTIRESKDAVCYDILTRGKLLYKREGA